MDRSRRLLSWVFAFFLGLVIAAFIGMGGAAFYPVPTPPDYSQTVYSGDGSVSDPAQEALASKRYEAEQAAYQKAEALRSRNLGTILLLIGTAVAVAGVLTERKLGVLANGMLLGGTFTIFWVNARYFTTYGVSEESFLVPLLAALLSTGVIAGLGYWRFTRGFGDPEVPQPATRQQFEGLYSLLTAVAVAYTFVVAYLYVWGTLLHMTDFDSLSFAVYSLVVGVSLAGASLFLSRRSLVLANGFMGGAFLSLFAGVVTLMFNGDDLMTKFLVTAAALVVTAGLGWLRFVRYRVPEEAEESGPTYPAALPAPEPSRLRPDPFDREPVVVGYLGEAALLWNPLEGRLYRDGQPLQDGDAGTLLSGGGILWDTEAVRSEPELAAWLLLARGR